MIFRFFLFFIFISFVSANSYSQGNTISISRSFQEYVTNRVANNDIGGNMVAFTLKEDTQGSPYLFKNWAKGKVVLTNKQMLQEPSYSLNFDKMKHQLTMMLSNGQILSVNMHDIESFTLTDDSARTYKLTKVDRISADYVIELYNDSSFSLYKSIQTRFYKSNYKNKGIYEEGYKYDRYVDKANYYIKHGQEVVNLNNGSKNDLKKLKASFPQIKTFKEENSSTNLDDYLLSIVIYLNKN